MSSWISERLSRGLNQVKCSYLSLVLMKGHPVGGPSPPILCLASKIWSFCSMLCGAIISDEQISVGAHRRYAVVTSEAVFCPVFLCFLFRFQQPYENCHLSHNAWLAAFLIIIYYIIFIISYNEIHRDSGVLFRILSVLNDAPICNRWRSRISWNM